MSAKKPRRAYRSRRRPEGTPPNPPRICLAVFHGFNGENWELWFRVGSSTPKFWHLKVCAGTQPDGSRKVARRANYWPEWSTKDRSYKRLQRRDHLDLKAERPELYDAVTGRLRYLQDDDYGTYLSQGAPNGWMASDELPEGSSLDILAAGRRYREATRLASDPDADLL